VRKLKELIREILLESYNLRPGNDKKLPELYAGKPELPDHVVIPVSNTTSHITTQIKQISSVNQVDKRFVVENNDIVVKGHSYTKEGAFFIKSINTIGRGSSTKGLVNIGEKGFKYDTFSKIFPDGISNYNLRLLYAKAVKGQIENYDKEGAAQNGKTVLTIDQDIASQALDESIEQMISDIRNFDPEVVLYPESSSGFNQIYYEKLKQKLNKEIPVFSTVKKNIEAFFDTDFARSDLYVSKAAALKTHPENIDKDDITQKTGYDTNTQNIFKVNKEIFNKGC